MPTATKSRPARSTASTSRSKATTEIKKPEPEHEPDELQQDKSRFDKFASWASNFVSSAPFFAFCVALVVIWLPTYPAVRNFDTWQLLINTPTTILTFLLVAILQNSQRRVETAIHVKLDAIAEGLADLMDHTTAGRSGDTDDLAADMEKLRKAVGLGED